MPDSSRLRAVLDTNVLVSATLFPRSLPAKAIDLVRSSYTLLASRTTLDELTDVISRDKFDQYISLQERMDIVRQIMLESKLIEVRDMVRVCRDARDDKFLGLAVAGGASLLISGDQDLLVLNLFHGIEILTPAAFLAR